MSPAAVQTAMGNRRVQALMACICYSLLVFGLSRYTAISFNHVELQPAGPWIQRMITLIVVALGFPIFFVAPGACWLTCDRNEDALVRSLLLSLLLQTALLSALKGLMHVELTRSFLLASTIAIIVGSFVRKPMPSPSSTKSPFSELAFSVGLVAMLVTVLYAKTFIESFSGDGVQHHAFVESLRQHLLPYWDLENGFYGFNPRSFTYAYLGLIAELHMGGIEAAVRLPPLIIVGVLLKPIVSFVPLERRQWWMSGLAALALSLVVLLNASYGTWHPYFSDLASPFGLDLIAVFFTIVALAFQHCKRRGWYLVSGLLACFSHPGGMPLIGIAVATSWIVSTDRQESFLDAVLMLTGVLMILGLLSIVISIYPQGQTEYSIQALLGRYDGFHLAKLTTDAKYLLLTSAGAAALAPFIARDRLSWKVISVALAYGILMSLQHQANLHYYLAPAVLLVPVMLRSVAFNRNSRVLGAVYCSLLVCVAVLSLPIGVPVIQDSRRIGKSLRVIGETYEIRVARSEVIYTVLPFREYGLSHHALLYYADRSQCQIGECAWVIAEASDAPLGYMAQGQLGEVRVFHRNDLRLPEYVREDREYCREILRDVCRTLQVPLTERRRQATPRRTF